jgi:hypothetical protein
MVLKAHRGRKERQVHKALRVKPAHRALRERQDHKVLRVRRENRARMLLLHS